MPTYELGRLYRNAIRQWATEHWGPRCQDFEPVCDICKAWHAIDTLFDGVPETQEECAAEDAVGTLTGGE